MVRVLLNLGQRYRFALLAFLLTGLWSPLSHGDDTVVCLKEKIGTAMGQPGLNCTQNSTNAGCELLSQYLNILNDNNASLIAQQIKAIAIKEINKGKTDVSTQIPGYISDLGNCSDKDLPNLESVAGEITLDSENNPSFPGPVLPEIELPPRVSKWNFLIRLIAWLRGADNEFKPLHENVEKFTDEDLQYCFMYAQPEAETESFEEILKNANEIFQEPTNRQSKLTNFIRSALASYRLETDERAPDGLFRKTGRRFYDRVYQLKEDEFKKELREDVQAVANAFFKCHFAIKVIYEYKFKTGKLKREDYDAKPNASFDNAIFCEQKGIQTMDFKDCSTFADTYSGFQVGKVGLQAVQGVQAQAESASLSQQLITTGANDPTSAIKAQKSIFETQRDMTHQRIALDSAKFGTLMVLRSQIPTQEGIVDKYCPEKYVSELDTVNTLLNKDPFISVSKIDSIGGETVCFSAVEEFAFVQNQDSLFVMNKILAGNGVDIVTGLAESNTLKKQRDLVQGAIDQVENFNPAGPIITDELVRRCELEPNAEGCDALSGGLTGLNDFNSNFNVDFGAGVATTGNNTDFTNPNNDDGGALSDGSNTAPVGDLGSPIDAVNKGGGFVDNKPGAATVSPGQKPGGGSSGGGANASAGALQGKSGSGEDKGNSPSPYTPSKISYNEGGGGSTYSGGKSGSSDRSDSKSTNPFADLFPKKEKKGGQILNFRDLASVGVGNQQSDIFKRITNRYGAISQSNRLLDFNRP